MAKQFITIADKITLTPRPDIGTDNKFVSSEFNTVKSAFNTNANLLHFPVTSTDNGDGTGNLISSLLAGIDVGSFSGADATYEITKQFSKVVGENTIKKLDGSAALVVLANYVYTIFPK